MGIATEGNIFVFLRDDLDAAVGKVDPVLSGGVVVVPVLVVGEDGSVVGVVDAVLVVVHGGLGWVLGLGVVGGRGVVGGGVHRAGGSHGDQGRGGDELKQGELMLEREVALDSWMSTWNLF